MGGGYLEKTLLRVLLVDDYEPWRRYICSTIQEQSEFDVIAEAVDGLEAVQIAQQLQPDLILLDIGLPRLNGIEAARRIREVSPTSKILFVSEHRSREVADEALRSGASGYVVKSTVASELLPAVRAVIQGEQFLSENLTGLYSAHYPFRENAVEMMSRQSQVPHHHEVGFFSDGQRFLHEVAGFVETSLRLGNAAVVAATESHQDGLFSELQGRGLDMPAALKQGRYLVLDAHHTLSWIMVNGVIDPDRFLEGFGDLIMAAREAAKGESPRVSVFGECVHLLWANGNAEAAIQFEKLGNKLTQIHDVDIFCGYSLDNVENEMDHHLFQRICAEHSAVYSQ
jgi:DNA-binding NarL/FixJ family response regulator